MSQWTKGVGQGSFRAELSLIHILPSPEEGEKAICIKSNKQTKNDSLCSVHRESRVKKVDVDEFKGNDFNLVYPLYNSPLFYGRDSGVLHKTKLKLVSVLGDTPRVCIGGLGHKTLLLGC